MRDAAILRRTLAAVLAVLIFATLVSVLPAARGALPLPSLVAGSRWSYAYAQYAGSGGNMTTQATGTYVLDELGSANITEGGATYLCDHMAIHFNATYRFGNSTAAYTFTGDVYYRRSDLALVQETLRATFFGGTLTVTISDAPPLALQWPLTPGSNWTSSTVQTSTSSTGGPPSTSTSNVSVDYRVGATVTRTVPAGLFATTPLNGTGANGSYTQQYWSPVVGFWVEQETGTNSSQEQFRLVSYRIGPANTPPTASFVWSPTGGDTTTLFTFASTSSDAQDAAGALQVRWDWNGDGTWDTGWSTNANATHTFPAAGVYNVTLEVMDTGGLTSIRTHQVTVVAANPLTSSVLGIPVYGWLLLLAAIAAAGVAYVLLRRRRTRTPPPLPPTPPPAP